MTNDWSKISTGDLLTLTDLFDRALMNDDGTWSIQLTAVHWSRCAHVNGEIVQELEARVDRGLAEN